MQKLNITGGAKIGKKRVTWPFGSLEVTRDKLILNAQFSGYYIFHPDEIVSIQEDSGGIKIIHEVLEYDEQILFLTSNNPLKLISKIRDTGFLDGKERSKESLKEVVNIREVKKGFPFRKSYSVIFSIVWSALFIYDFVNFYLNNMEGLPLGNGSIIAVTSAFVVLVLLLTSHDFSKNILTPGWEINDFQKTLIFFLLVLTLILVNIFVVFKFFLPLNIK